MKKVIKVVKELVLRAAALVILSALTIFNGALKFFTFIFRFVAIPAVVIGLLITAVTYFDNGYSTSLLLQLVSFLGVGVLYYVLPIFPPAIDRTELRMKNYIFSPLVVRSPVKFTL